MIGRPYGRTQRFGEAIGNDGVCFELEIAHVIHARGLLLPKCSVLQCDGVARTWGGTVVFVVVVRRHGEMSGHNLLD